MALSISPNLINLRLRCIYGFQSFIPILSIIEIGKQIFPNILDGVIPIEIGKQSMLEMLDVLRNSLTHEIHKELGNCYEHYVLVFTNLLDYTLGKNYIDSEPTSGLSNCEKLELNYFQGDFPVDLLTFNRVKIIWALQTTQNGTFLRVGVNVVAW